MSFRLILFYFPLIIAKLILKIRRDRFIQQYKASSELNRKVSQSTRNTLRRLDYELKKKLWTKR